MTAHSDIHLFLRLEPDIPHLTHQNGIKARAIKSPDGRSWIGQIYKTPALRDLEAKYISLLRPFAPPEPWNCPICLTTEWIFRKPKDAKGIFKTTKPDITNLLKTFEDCMTRFGFWKDDALVVIHYPVKLWAEENEPHGIRILIQDYSIKNQ